MYRVSEHVSPCRRSVVPEIVHTAQSTRVTTALRNRVCVCLGVCVCFDILHAPDALDGLELLFQ